MNTIANNVYSKIGELLIIILKYSGLGASRKFVDFQGTLAISCKFLVRIYFNPNWTWNVEVKVKVN